MPDTYRAVIDRMRPSEMAAALQQIADTRPAVFTAAVAGLPEATRLLGGLRTGKEAASDTHP